MDGCLREKLPVLWRNELKKQEKALVTPAFAETEDGKAMQ